MSAGRRVWVKIRASEAERAEWHAKARSAGLTLSDLVRRSLGRVRTWTVAHAEVEREQRTRELAPRQQPQPDRPLGQSPQAGGRGRRLPGRHRPMPSRTTSALRCTDVGFADLESINYLVLQPRTRHAAYAAPGQSPLVTDWRLKTECGIETGVSPSIEMDAFPLDHRRCGAAGLESRTTSQPSR